jgi:hypothetical protein
MNGIECGPTRMNIKGFTSRPSLSGVISKEEWPSCTGEGGI